MRARSTAAALALLLLAAPTAFADWAVKGAFEPDTMADVRDGFMALTPDRAQVGRVVYFNGFWGAGGLVTTTMNPNIAMVGSAVLPTPSVPVALFGIWRDCNGDGFVGLGDHGALEYASRLLLDASICPVITAPEPAWAAHNDGQWVVEYIPIGYDDTRTSADENPLNINDTTARVWADWGVPDTAPGLVCPITPAPAGTFRSTGGMLRYADCHAGLRGSAAVNLLAAAAGAPGLGFSDAPPDRPDRSGSPLNRANPWGSEGDAAAVMAFDCSRRTDVAVVDPTGGLLDPIADDDGVITEFSVFGIDPRVEPDGSPAGTLNETEAALTDCDRSDAGEIVDLDGKDDGSDADLPYALEGPSEPSSAFSPRTRPDFAFTFEEGSRSSLLASLVLGPRTREQAGLGTISVTGFWVGTSGTGTRNPYLARQDLGVEPVTYVTYYAAMDTRLIDPLALVLPSGAATATYGSLGCAAGAFACDRAAWWRDALGEPTMPRDARLGSRPGQSTLAREIPATEIGARVGDPYVMRDVDCYDTSIRSARDAGVHWGALTGRSCDRP